ncbi:MAG: hypothetical protein KKA90_01095 [Nanoarchaeota archaeon]|nr:hypothetical protein [Nanoarchaeota archaeon]
MVTTIQISEQLQKELTKQKFVQNETYEEVIWDLLEDIRELSEETKRDLALARTEVKQGKIKTFEQIKKELSL